MPGNLSRKPPDEGEGTCTFQGLSTWSSAEDGGSDHVPSHGSSSPLPTEYEFESSQLEGHPAPPGELRHSSLTSQPSSGLVRSRRAPVPQGVPVRTRYTTIPPSTGLSMTANPSHQYRDPLSNYSIHTSPSPYNLPNPDVSATTAREQGSLHYQFVPPYIQTYPSSHTFTARDSQSPPQPQLSNTDVFAPAKWPSVLPYTSGEVTPAPSSSSSSLHFSAPTSSVSQKSDTTIGLTQPFEEVSRPSLPYVPSKVDPLGGKTLTEYIKGEEIRLKDAIYHFATLGPDVWKRTALEQIKNGDWDTYLVQRFDDTYYQGENTEVLKRLFRDFDEMRRTFTHRINIYGNKASRSTFMDTVEYTSAHFREVDTITWLLHHTCDFSGVELAVSLCTRATSVVIEGKGYDEKSTAIGGLDKTRQAIEKALTSLLMAQVPRHPDNTRADDSDVHARLRTIRVHGCPGRVLTRFSLRLRSNGILTEIYLPANLQRQRAAYERMIGQWMKDSQSQDLAANRILFKQAPASSAAVLLVQQNHFHFAKPPQLNHLSATWKPSAVSHLARASEAICLNNSKVKFQFKRLHMAVRCHSRDLLGGKAVYIVWGVNGRTMEC